MKILISALLLILAFSASGEIIYVNILHTNDIHGGIVSKAASFMNPNFPPMMGGGHTLPPMSKMFVKNARKQENTAF